MADLFSNPIGLGVCVLAASGVVGVRAAVSRRSAPVSKLEETVVTAAPVGASKVAREDFKGVQVVVTKPEGFFCNVAMRGKVDMGCDELFDLLIDPNNARIFRSIKATPYRKVLEDDGRGRQVVEVQQDAIWRFLCFSGTFSTRMIVVQDRRKRTIDFKLAKQGMMKNFEGKWRLEPARPGASGPNTAAAAQPAQGNPLHSAQRFWQQRQHDLAGLFSYEPASTFVTLDQSVLPAVVPPGPLGDLLQAVAARQVRTIMEDLQTEVDRRNRQKRLQRSTNGSGTSDATNKAVAPAAHVTANSFAALIGWNPARGPLPGNFKICKPWSKGMGFARSTRARTKHDRQ